MRFLKDLMVETSDDLSRLPKDVVSKIRSKIRKGAEDLSQKWANALELVHKAYEVEGVERPDPSMEAAWKQYEENLQYAVQQLASNRGMDGDWRMSSSMFHEALQPRSLYNVHVTGTDLNETYTVEAKNITEIVETFDNTPGFNVKIDQKTPNVATIRFSRLNIQQNLKIQISNK